MEARVESARRASEIHKRRTGRSLRVTEQNVINEEMYEEEDNDLPAQYQRLIAHLQTSSPAFNQRLAAYLMGQVGVRSAIDQYLFNSYEQQQFPNPQQFPFLQPMHQTPNVAQHFQQPMMGQSKGPSSMYRQAPYPLLNHHLHSSGMHGRSASIANSQVLSMSLASAPVSTASFDQVQTFASNTAIAPEKLRTTPQTGYFLQRQSKPFQAQYDPSSLGPNISPFAIGLPPELQMFLGSALDPGDPMTTNMLADGSQHSPNPSYEFDGILSPTFSIGKGVSDGQLDPNFDGIDTTISLTEPDIKPRPDFHYTDQTNFFDAGVKRTTESWPGTPGGTGDFGLFSDNDIWGGSAPSSLS